MLGKARKWLKVRWWARRANRQIRRAEPLLGFPFTDAPRDTGGWTLMVYREAAECGCWCATGEGEMAPTCCHGHAMLPLSDLDAPRLGAAVRFVPEQEAVTLVAALGGVRDPLRVTG